MEHFKVTISHFTAIQKFNSNQYSVRHQGCALRKILGGPSGTQSFTVGCPEVKLGSPDKAMTKPDKKVFQERS